ncbi:MAG: NAD-dependent deacylase, partial [Muribaculaceae bacterium]|nr:NAD-dependent deacylase [Muribaculaceae bacterium]
MKKKLVISTGAGISAESGISTFRDANGLWENYNVMDVCSADGFVRNPALVHDFYNDRRAQLATVAPNAAHHALVDLKKDFDVYVITQNVDDLHERAGSSHTLHLHGELMT